MEQVIADLKGSALKHFPSGSFSANGAWLACAVIAHNLARAAGVLAGGKLRKARTGTIRTKLINIPARVSYSARGFTLHLPANSHRQDRFITMFDTIQAPHPKRPDPCPTATPGPTQHHPGHPDDRSGDTGYPSPDTTKSKINSRISRSTSIDAVDRG